MKSLLIALVPLTLFASDIHLAWDPSPDFGVDHYRLYAFTNSPPSSSNNFTNVNVGTNLTATLEPLQAGRFWFAVTAVGTNQLESDFSNVVEVEIPNPPEHMRVLAVQWSATLTNFSDVGFFRLKLP